MVTMITETGLNKSAQAVADLLNEAVVTIDAIEETYQFYGKEVSEDTITATVLLGTSAEGHVTNLKIMDTGADVYAERQEDFQKQEGKTHLLTFKFRVFEEAV